MDTSAQVKIVTPEQALSWLSKAGYDKQRTIRDYWTTYLADEMARGSFEPSTQITFLRHNGSMELVDGQHRLSAVVKSGLAQKFVVVVRDVETEGDVANAYYRLDQALRRTTTDQYRVLGLSDELDLTATDLNALGASVKFIWNNFQKSTGAGRALHPDERLLLIREYQDAARHYFTAKMGCPSEISSSAIRAATVSVALVTYRYSSQEYGLAKVDEFWHGVLLDDNVSKGDIRKQANRHLLTTGMMSSSGNQFANAVSPAYSARLLARCFNAFASNENLKQAKVLDSTAPMLILGSPFTGK